MTSHFSSAASASTVDDDMLWNLGKAVALADDSLHATGGWAGAIKYLEYVKRTLHNPDTHQIGFQCPKEGILCKTVEFDNIKVFYHPTYPDRRVPSWNLYIARPGASASECIHWAAEGTDIITYGPGGKWGECRILVFPPGARIRISYTFRHKRHTQEIVLPETGPSIPIIQLEGM